MKQVSLRAFFILVFCVGFFGCRRTEPVERPIPIANIDNVLYVGSDQNKFYAINALTGEKQWEAAVSGQPAYYGPAFANGILYCPNGGNLVALNATTGTKKWEVIPSPGSIITPIIDSETLYISGGNTLAALNATNGATRWSSSWGEAGGKAALANNVLFATGFRATGLYAVSAATGQPKWMFPIQVATIPYVDAESVYITNIGVLYAVRQSNGSKRWEAEVGDMTSALFTDDKTVYLIDFTKVLALNKADGRVKWTFDLKDTIRKLYMRNGVLYAGGFGKFYAIDANTGAQKFMLDLPKISTISVLKATDDAVYVGSGYGSGSFYAFDLNTGATKWSYLSGFNNAAIGNNGVYLTTADRKLVALDLATGATKWAFKPDDNLITDYCLTGKNGKVVE